MKSTLRVICGGLLVILILLTVALTVYLYYQPLGPSLVLNSPAYAPEENESATLKQPPAQTKAFWYGKQPQADGEPAAVRNATRVVAQALLDNYGYMTEKYLMLKMDQRTSPIDRDLSGYGGSKSNPQDGNDMHGLRRNLSLSHDHSGSNYTSKFTYRPFLSS